MNCSTDDTPSKVGRNEDVLNRILDVAALNLSAPCLHKARFAPGAETLVMGDLLVTTTSSRCFMASKRDGFQDALANKLAHLHSVERKAEGPAKGSVID